MAENKRPEHYDEPDLLSADQLQEIEEKFDLGYHLKHVDTIFARVFGS